MGGDNDDKRRLETPPRNSERLPRDERDMENREHRGSERRGRSRTRRGSHDRQRSPGRGKGMGSRHSPSQTRYSVNSRPSRNRDELEGGRRSRRRSKPRTIRTSRSYSRRREGSSRSRSDSRKRSYDLHERIRLLEDQILRERDLRRQLKYDRRSHRASVNVNEIGPRKSTTRRPPFNFYCSQSDDAKSPDRKKPRYPSTPDFFEEFVKIFKGKDRETFPVLNNVIPDFDPLCKEQTIDMWLNKVDECSEIYCWNDKQTVHYALPKLCGHAKTWYQGLPSIKHTWIEWKNLLRESFPSTENYAELLTDMLNRKARPGESLELYYFSKINLLNRCKIFGKQAVDCLIFGIDDKGVRLSAQAAKFEKPEDALEFFKTIKPQTRDGTDFRRESTFRDKRYSNTTTTTNNSRKTIDNNNRPKTSIVCFNCSEAGHPSFKCPKPLTKCSDCNFIGHDSSSCPKKKGCTFPARWHGRWFQSGVIQPILIEADRLSNKGKCISNEGDKFLIVDEKGCYRCVVMHEKHKNVLQYKETFCHRRDALPHLCSLITGDALLYSMFRENADPVDCPLKGPFSFTYNRGHGDCKSPVSSIETCTEDSRLLLNYQACPDVHGSESAVEELECLATWKEGSLRFLVGKLHHNHATSNEDRYRCFVYEKTNGIASGAAMKEGPTSPAGVEYRVAQSGDATCNGLFSATEGSRTMALKRVSVRFNCQFPSWMTFSHTWHTLDFSSNYTFYQRNATLRITNQTGADIKVYCVNVKASSPSGNSVALVAHWQHHCASRYVCVVLYRRDTFIAELQRGSPTTRPDDACSPHHFNAVTAPYVTLVASNPESKECPYSGKYSIQNRHRRSIRSPHGSERDKNILDDRRKRDKAMLEHNRRINGTRLFNFSVRNMSETPMLRSRRQLDGNDVSCAVGNYNRLEVGCNSVKNMEFYSTCDSKEVVTAYTCHGGWYESGASFVVTTPITRDSTAARRYCFVSRETRTGALELTRSASNCERATTEPEPLVFDATSTGECQDQTNNQNPLRIPSSPIVYLAITILHYIIPR